MPVPPYTWQIDDFLTAGRLNGELYRTGGALFAPNGTGFHGQRPIYKSFGKSPAFGSSAWTFIGGNTAPFVFTWPVLADTGAMFGHRLDPVQGGSILLNVPNSGGALGSAGGLGVVTLTTTFGTGLNTNVGAGMSPLSGILPDSQGTVQNANQSYNSAPWALDIMDLNPSSGPIGAWALQGGANAIVPPSATDGSGGGLSRFGAHWASVYPANGATVSAIPALTASYTDSTPLTAALMNANIQQLMSLLNMPPLLRVAATGTTSVPNGTATVINFPAATWDTYGGWNSSTDTYTVPLPGIYLVAGFAPFGDIGNCHIAAAADINGTTIWGPSVTAVSGLTSAAGKAGIFDLNAGDTVKLQAFQGSGTTQSCQAGSIFVVLYLGAQGIASPVPSTPDENYSFIAGTPGSRMAGLLTQHVGNDLNFLLNKPYFLGYQATAQNNASEGVSKALAIDTIKGLIHGIAGDPWGGWNAPALKWAAPVSGWYMAVEEIFAIPPTQPNATCAAALAVSPAGANTPDFYQQNNCAAGVTSTGACAVGYYYLRAGDTVQPMFWENGFFNTGAVGTNVATGINSHFEVVFLGE